MKTKSPRQETEASKLRMRLVKGSREEPISCTSCRKDISAGYRVDEPGKKPRITCDTCGIEEGIIAQFDLLYDVHPWNRNPEMKPEKARFALRQNSDERFWGGDELKLTEDPAQARLFGAGYLNVCNWEWHAFNTIISEQELKKLIAESKKKTKQKK